MLYMILLEKFQPKISAQNPVSGGFAPNIPPGALPLDPAGDFRPPRPPNYLPGLSSFPPDRRDLEKNTA